MKNAYALGVSLAVGLAEKRDGKIGSQHYNSQAALFGQSVKEMTKLLELIGGKPENIIHGAGDLYVTIFGGRTRKIGTLLGRGLSFEEAMAELQGVTLESIVISTRTARAVRKLAERGIVSLEDFPLLMHVDAIINQGAEVNIPWKDFTWNTGVTYSMNKNKILTLADNAINPITHEKFSISSLNMGGLGSTRFILKEGGSMGDIYSLMDLKRDANGAVYIDENNSVVTESLEANNYIKLGSVLPKGNLAWRNNFSWKNINVAFLVSARLGGVVFSRTQAVLDNFGVSEASAAARDKGYVSVNGNDRVNPEGWYSVVAGGTAVPQYYIYSATIIRLQEAAIGYTIARIWLGNVCDIKVSLIGRNLWMIYNKAPFDPESVASTDNFYQGIDYFMMPSLRNIGFNLSFKF